MRDAPTSEGLVRGLGLGSATSVVVGVVIGSGIFIGGQRASLAVNDTWSLIGLWIFAGLLTLLGALNYAELGAMFPRSGGDYVYLREGLGPFWGFFNGWTAFSVNYPASIGAIGLAAASQLDQLKPPDHVWVLGEDFSVKFTAAALILVFTIINYLGVRMGGAVQFIVTAAKVILILGLVVFAFLSPNVDAARLGQPAAGPAATLGVAFIGILWAYDGWGGVGRVAGEVKDPQRNVPRALILGILLTIAVYVLLQLVYVAALGIEGMRGEGLADADRNAIASRAATALFGGGGNTFVSILILVSVLATLNGLTLAGSRIYFAMARDRVFFEALGRLHPATRVPHVSLLIQGILSAILALFFTFGELNAFVVLSSWVAYAMSSIALIRLRRTRPMLERPYRVPFYPWTPIIFLTLSTAFVVYLVFGDALPTALQGEPKTLLNLLGNLALMALALPLWFIFRPRRTPPPVPAIP